MNKFTDDTPIAMLTVGQLKEILSIDKIGTSNSEPRSGQRGADSCRPCPAYRVQYLYGL